MLKDLFELRQEIALCNLVDCLKKPAELSDETWQKELTDRKKWLLETAQHAQVSYPISVSEADEKKIDAWFAQEPQLNSELENLYTIARTLINNKNRFISPFTAEHKAKKLLSESVRQNLQDKLRQLQTKIDACFTNLQKSSLIYEAIPLCEELLWLNYPTDFNSEKFSTLPKKTYPHSGMGFIMLRVFRTPPNLIIDSIL